MLRAFRGSRRKARVRRSFPLGLSIWDSRLEQRLDTTALIGLDQAPAGVVAQAFSNSQGFGPSGNASGATSAYANNTAGGANNWGTATLSGTSQITVTTPAQGDTANSIAVNGSMTQNDSVTWHTGTKPFGYAGTETTNDSSQNQWNWVVTGAQGSQEDVSISVTFVPTGLLNNPDVQYTMGFTLSSNHFNASFVQSNSVPPPNNNGSLVVTNNGNQLFNAGLLNNTATYDTGKIAATTVEQVSWSASLQVTIGGFWTTHTDTATPSFSFQYKVTEV